jgi:hypothetical protein
VECSQSHELLSAYVDDVLLPKERQQLEEHLAVCPACMEELQALEAYLAAMHSLERIDAPRDFIHGVHERLDRASLLRRLAKKIFVPLHIKIPLELAGIAAALLIAVFSYHEVNQQRQMTVAPPVREEPQSLRKGPPAQPPVEKKADEAGGLGQNAKRAQRSGGTQPIELVLWIRSEKDQVKMKRESIERAGEEQKLSPAAPAPIQSIPESQPMDQARPVLREKEAPPGKVHGPSLSATTGTAGTAGKDQASPRRDADRVLSEVEDLVQSHHGTLAPPQPEEKTDAARFVVARIPAGNYLSFLEQLRHLGRLQEPQAGNGTAPGLDPVLVKISLLPSED